MVETIHLHKAKPTGATKRLNLFAGRSMGEAAFDKLQAYTEARIAPLLSGQQPGVIAGLTLYHYAADFETIRLHPGRGVTPQGSAVGLFIPVKVQWDDLLKDLLEANADHLTSPVSGLYLLALQRSTVVVDYDQPAACRRSEENPLRDTRNETVGRLVLLEATDYLQTPSDLLKENQFQVVNRLLAGLINRQLELPHHALVLGLAAVNNDNLVWLESDNFRFKSRAHAYHHALLKQTEQQMQSLVHIASNAVSISSIDSGSDTKSEEAQFAKHLATGMADFSVLPAAGSLPPQLLRNIDHIVAPLPKLLGVPENLRVDMVPVAVSGIAGVLRRELPRGLINLASNSKDRMRLLIVVPDKDFDPQLLDVPQSDKKLSDQLYQYGMKSVDQWLEWADTFNRLYSVVGVTDSQISAEEIALLKLPKLGFSPIFPQDFFTQLIQDNTPEVGNITPPYREGVPAYTGYKDWENKVKELIKTLDGSFDTNTHKDPGLLVEFRISELKHEMFQSFLEECTTLLERLNDLLLTQRQQLDAQTVAFATFAGGVAGDGSGMQLTRWLPFSQFSPETEPTSTPTPTPRSTMKKVTSRGLPPIDSPQSRASGFNIQPAAMSGLTGMGWVGGLGGLGNTEWIGNLGGFADTSGVGITTAEAEAKGSFVGRAGTAVGSTGTIGRSNPATSGVKFTEETIMNYGSNQAYVSAAFQKAKKSDYETLLGTGKKVDKLSLIGHKRTPLSNAAFSTPNKDFGVLGHVSLVHTEYANSRSAVIDLRDKLKESLKEIADFVTKLKEHGVGTIEIADINLDENEKLEVELLNETALNKFIVDNELDTNQKKSKQYDLLFKAGRRLIDHISLAEMRRVDLNTINKNLLKKISKTEVDAQKLGKNIILARKKLGILDAIRLEALDDYSVAQRLVTEHWQEVAQRFLHRNEVLRNMLGLYYVRVRETSTSLVLTTPQNLRHTDPEDLVPGCSLEDSYTVPDELAPFIDAVQDIPVRQWVELRKRIHWLPGRLQLESWMILREKRLIAKQQTLQYYQTHASRPVLQSLMTQNQVVYQSFARRKLTSKNYRSAVVYQQASADVLSLEDLLSGSPHRLRRTAQKLSDNLGLASACLLDNLNQLPPSIRLQWAQLAEDDQLPIQRPQAWPGLESAEDAAFNALRTTLELVHWLNRQLINNADADSYTAMHNLVRAVLLIASSDNPKDLLTGKLQIAPGRLIPGSILNLKLGYGQELIPGAMMQLLNKQQKTVAQIRLDDQDEKGVVATVVSLMQAHVKIENIQDFSLIGHKFR